MYVTRLDLVGNSGVQLTQDFGGSWSTRQSQFHDYSSENIQLNLLNNQQFEFTISKLYRSSIANEADHVQVCKYTGTFSSIFSAMKN